MKATAEIDKTAYSLARAYLPHLKIAGVTESLLARYSNPASLNPRPTTKHGLYQRILESAQNTNMKAGVIGKSIGGVGKLAAVLENFVPEAVVAKFGNDVQAILADIKKTVNPRGKFRNTPQGIWPLYCKTILSAAAFVQQYDTADEFFAWVDFFDRDDRARPSLPMLLSREIKGFGFALSCDFLKELGYVNFPKPDVHLRDIFTALRLFPDGEDDYQLFKAIVRVARNANVSPYNADKTFWLIGSGFFYEDLHIGNNGRIGNHKKMFIHHAEPILNGMR